jgi:two-component system, LytTR family, response regulator LytT
VNSIDYLLKPIDKVELGRSLEKFNRLNQHSSAVNPDVTQIIKSLRDSKPNYKTRFLVKTGQTFITFFTQDVAYFILTINWFILSHGRGKNIL